MTSDPRYSVVVPVYGNEATLAATLERIEALAERLDGGVEAVFVVDGSPDGSLALLRRLLAEPRPISAQLLSLSRNFGSFSAIRAGLAAARGDLLAVLAADLQEPTSLIESFFAALGAGEHDVAVGVRTARADPPLSRALSNLFWGVGGRFVHADMPRHGVDVFACTRQVADRIAGLEEAHSSLVGLLYWVGFRRLEVPYERQPRPHGRSGWSFRRKLRYLLDSVYSFTDVPISLITALGIVGVLSSSLIGAVVLVAWLAGSIEVAGYTPLMLALVFFGSTILLSLGVIGSYVWRTYENTKRRPSAIVMSSEDFPAQPSTSARNSS
jgi:glycosyltransferase involved in cell wall biosynthesis